MSTDEELQAQVVRLESDVADLSLSLQQLREELAEAVAGGTVKAEAPTPAGLEAWVADTLAPLYARHIGPGWKWCPRWWSHEEAESRLSALYVGCKEAQQTGRMLAWWRDADAVMAALADPSGTFAACGREHHPADPLPCEAAPAEWLVE
jgi:hypothetical protein